MSATLNSRLCSRPCVASDETLAAAAPSADSEAYRLIQAGRLEQALVFAERAVAGARVCLPGRSVAGADNELFALTSKRSGSVHGLPLRSAASKRTMVPVSRSASRVKRR